jgi:hypothetical protein
MASSAIRRSVWTEKPFDEEIRYSEDILWSWQRKQEGWKIAYAAGSIAMHSHNYTHAEVRKRFHGEGKADAAIYPRNLLETGLLRGVLLPFAAEVVRDFLWLSGHGHLDALLEAPVVRFLQKTSYRRGLIEGLAHV